MKDKEVITTTLILPPRRGRKYRSLVLLLQGGGDLRKEKDGFPFPVFTRTGSMGMTDKMGTIHRAPTLGKMRKDKGVITPTLVLPPRRGRKYMSLGPPFQGGGEVK